MKVKCAVLYETGEKLNIEHLEIPKLKNGQVLVKILYSGVCRSQLNEIKAHKGPDKHLPHTLGHEASGIIQEIGEGVTKVVPGDYVILTWIKGEGMDVPFTSYQNENGETINSGAITTFNEMSVISENRVIKAPIELPPELAPLFGCAIPTGVGIIFNQLKVKRGDSIAIFGIGGIGASALLGAVAANASIIIAIDINEKKLEFAKNNGATHVINPNNEDLVTKIKEITNNNGTDYAIDCSGIPKIIEIAFEIISDKGTMIIAGNPAQGEKIQITPFDLIKGKKIFGSWGGSTNPDKDIPFYIDLYFQKKLKINDSMIKIFPLEQINDALSSLDRGDVIRALIRME